MTADSYRKTPWNEPFIPQRADPYILRAGGKWYFTASVPAYDRIILRAADTLAGLREAEEVIVWHAHASGPMSQHIWAPELHFLRGAWYIYFAASEKEDIWKLRPWVLRCEGKDPLVGPWSECGIPRRAADDEYSFTDFSLDMTVFEHRDRLFCVWAEKVSTGRKISNLYLAEMEDPLTLKTPQLLLSAPAYAWERHGFWVNEGPAFTVEGDRVYLTYSASDTGPAYCMGMLWAPVDAELTDISQWHRVNHPVLRTDVEKGLYGPGHNTFFRDEEGALWTAFHARPYDVIHGDPLYDPNRHCYLARVRFRDGLPAFEMMPQRARSYRPSPIGGEASDGAANF